METNATSGAGKSDIRHQAGQPEGPACAARAIGYLRGLLEALEPAHGG